MARNTCIPVRVGAVLPTVCWQTPAAQPAQTHCRKHSWRTFQTSPKTYAMSVSWQTSAPNILKSQYVVSSQRKCTRTLTFDIFCLPRAGLLEGQCNLLVGSQTHMLHVAARRAARCSTKVQVQGAARGCGYPTGGGGAGSQCVVGPQRAAHTPRRVSQTLHTERGVDNSACADAGRERVCGGAAEGTPGGRTQRTARADRL